MLPSVQSVDLAGGSSADRLPAPACAAWLAMTVFAAYIPVCVALFHSGLQTNGRFQL